MNGWSFSLKPFPSAGPLPYVEITGNIDGVSNCL
jgi:hypothetical protein